MKNVEMPNNVREYFESEASSVVTSSVAGSFARSKLSRKLPR